MRHLALLVSVVTLLAGLAAFARLTPGSAAQEATPVTVGMTEEGLTFDPVAFAPGARLPGTGDLVVVRIGLDPGTGFPLEASDPSSGMLVVESGAFTVRADVPLAVTRGAGLTDAVATAEATGDFGAVAGVVAAGEAITLEAGDAAFIPGETTGEIRNEGPERAVGLAFLVVPGEGSQLAPPAATPSP